jgi:hypothetical protein
LDSFVLVRLNAAAACALRRRLSINSARRVVVLPWVVAPLNHRSGAQWLCPAIDGAQAGIILAPGCVAIHRAACSTVLCCLSDAKRSLHELAIAGTAVSNGRNTHPKFGSRIAAVLSRGGIRYRVPRNNLAALGGHEPIVFVHGVLKTSATALIGSAAGK